jgi:hypothetical protein
MHIGLTQTCGPPSTATVSAVKSVGQRLKEGKGFGSSTAITNGATANNISNSKSATKQQHEQRILRVHQPVILSELQKNTVRVIGQYLRELGMQ